MSKNFICMAPFSEIEIDSNGNLNCCCFQYTHYFWGNIFEEGFDAVWNGEKAKNFRKDIIDGKYTHCNTKICKYGFLDPVQEPPSLEAPYPQYITLAYDGACNLMCITCRDKIKKEDNYTEEQLLQNIEKYYIPACKNAKEIVLNSAGECLVSNKSKTLIKKLAETYPNLNFIILTNGTVCDEEVLKSLGLLGKISCLQVSVHAATKETYDKITRTGNFDAVMTNLKWLSQQKKKGVFPRIILNFVVHSLNYKEMPDFVILAKELDFEVSFWEFQKWSDDTEMFRNYEKYAVVNKKHHEYKKLLQILRNPVFDYEKCIFNNLFINLRKEALSQKSPFDKIKKYLTKLFVQKTNKSL